MPKRPPKRWWKKCVAGVKESGRAYSPEEVCGSLWHHKMTKKQKEKIVRDEEKVKKKHKKGKIDIQHIYDTAGTYGEAVVMYEQMKKKEEEEKKEKERK